MATFVEVYTFELSFEVIGCIIMRHKKLTDIIAMVFMVCAIITGIKLHNEVHHLYIYDDRTLWNAHIISGVIVAIALIFHCCQHKFWFNNYVKIPAVRKGVTTLLGALAVMVIISGVILAFGSHSQFISIFHYITAIGFTLVAVGHVLKRWRIFTALFKSHDHSKTK